ncbi:MAG: hypothetical protein WBC91_21875 [Phototrophicaceae bacterium]
MRCSFWRITTLLLVMSVISACNTNDATPTATPTASATRTISVADITAAATFIRTLPASFTPTFTPSVTPTRNTATPTPIPSLTPIAEAELCERFSVTNLFIQGNIPADSVEDYKQVYIDTDSVVINFEIKNLTTDEIIGTATLPGNTPWEFSFTPEFYPDIAEYEYVFTLADATRSGLCEQRGIFDTRADELPRTATPEVTVEATEPSEVTPEATELSESTAEATEVSEITATTSEPSTPRPFPPR